MILPASRLIRSRVLIPAGVPNIDWNNPLTYGLIAAYLPGHGRPVRNLAAPNSAFGADLTTVGSAITRFPTVEGMGIGALASTSGLASAANLPKPFQPAQASIYFRGVRNLATSAGSPALFASEQGTNSADFGISCGTSPSVFCIWNVGGTGGTGSTFAAGTTGKMYSLCGTFIPGGNAILYSDGAQVASNAMSAGSITYTTTTQKISMGQWTGSTTRFSGFVGVMGLIWNRALTPLEVWSLHQDPYQVFDSEKEDVLSSLYVGQSGRIVTLDYPTALEFLAATSADGGVNAESIGNIFAVPAGYLEILSRQSTDRGGAAEVLATARGDRPVPTEDAALQIGAAPGPTEWIAAQIADSIARAEILAGVRSDKPQPAENLATQVTAEGVPAEFLGSAQIAADGLVPLEGLARQVSDRGMPLEAVAGVTADRGVPVEAIGTTQGIGGAAVEVVSRLVTDARLYQEVLTGALVASIGQTELLGSVRSERPVPVESLGLLLVTADGLLPSEWSGRLAVTSPLGAEFLTAVTVDRRTIAEVLAGLNRVAPPVAEWIGSVSLSASGAVEATGRVSVSGPPAIELLLGLAADGAVAPEAIAKLFLDGVAPTESLGTISLVNTDGLIVIEWQGAAIGFIRLRKQVLSSAGLRLGALTAPDQRAGRLTAPDGRSGGLTTPAARFNRLGAPSERKEELE